MSSGGACKLHPLQISQFSVLIGGDLALNYFEIMFTPSVKAADDSNALSAKREYGKTLCRISLFL